MQPNVACPPTVTPEPTKSPVVQIDIVVLAEDTGFVTSVRESLEERAPVWRARSAEESVDLLLAGRCGVLLIDMDAVIAPPVPLIEQIVDQFPDVVVVVAARREEEAALAGLVAEGLIYRLIHKPFSVKRAGMFLQAAMRAHLQRRVDPTARPELPLTGKLRTRLVPHRLLAIGVGVVTVVCVAVTGLLLMHQARSPQPSQHDVQLPADPVLSQARAAFAAERYEAPAGRNALELYAAVLRDRPGNVEAQQGLEKTATMLVERAEAALAAGNAAEARRLAARVLEVAPQHAGARAVLAHSDAASRDSTHAVTAAGTRRTSADRASSVSPANGTVLNSARSAHAGAKPGTSSTTAGAQGRTARDGGASSASGAAATVATPVTGSRQAMASTQITSATPTASKTATAPSARLMKPHVYADPIAAVVVNEDELPSSRARSKLPRSGRSYGAPISSGHPTAGYVRRTSAAAAASGSAAPATTAIGSSTAAASEAIPTSMPSPLARGPAPQPALSDGDLLRMIGIEPAYPPDAFRNRIEGWAEVEFTVDVSGTPRDIAVTGAEPSGVFDAAAADAVAGWRYRPRVVNGRAVPQRTSVTLRFNVAD